MNSQPINPSIDYESKLSNEIKTIIESIKNDEAPLVPISELTLDMFFEHTLSTEDCLLYKVLNAFMNSTMIEVLANKFAQMITDTKSFMTLEATYKGLSREMKTSLIEANRIREEMKLGTITSDLVLLAILKVPEFDKYRQIFGKSGVTYDIVKTYSGTLHDIANELANDKFIPYIGGADMGHGNDHEATTVYVINKEGTSYVPLKQTTHGGTTEAKTNKSISGCVELVSEAEKGNIEPLIGRNKEINFIEDIFARKRGKNVILVGESGVGKTQIVRGLARNIYEGNCSRSFEHCEIYAMNLSRLTAGTQFRGMFESKIISVIESIKNRPQGVLFIDNIHMCVSDKQKNESDITAPLIDNLADGKLRCIAATTPKGYKMLCDSDPNFAKKFQRIDVQTLNTDECISLLNKAKSDYEKYHNVIYSESVIEAAVKLSQRYITDKPLPLSALEVIDAIGAQKKNAAISSDEYRAAKETLASLKKKREDLLIEDKLNEVKELDERIKETKKTIGKLSDELDANSKNLNTSVDDVYATISRFTNVPVSKLNTDERKTLSTIDKDIKKKIIGQDEAITSITRAIKRSKVGLYPKNRPIGSFLCIGNTGCGKTLMAKSLAKEIFGDEKYLVRFDMSEYADKTAVNKLIGASAGYIGFNEGGLLTEAIKNKKHAVVLIDEIEKADDQIFNIFLQILDEGFLTDNTGQKVDFKNTIIIMTSNVGVKEAALSKSIGFVVDENNKNKTVIEREMKKRFPPEFINRLDEVIYFNTLTDDNLKDIIRLELNNLNNRLSDLKFSLTYEEDVIGFIFEEIKDKKEYGARPIIKAIQNQIENKITDLLLMNDYEQGHVFNISEMLKEKTETV